MEHKFFVAQGFNGTTLRICEKCGLTHMLAKYGNNTARWVLVVSADETGDEEKPVSSCGQQEEVIDHPF